MLTLYKTWDGIGYASDVSTSKLSVEDDLHSERSLSILNC